MSLLLFNYFKKIKTYEKYFIHIEKENQNKKSNQETN